MVINDVTPCLPGGSRAKVSGEAAAPSSGDCIACIHNPVHNSVHNPGAGRGSQFACYICAEWFAQLTFLAAMPAAMLAGHSGGYVEEWGAQPRRPRLPSTTTVDHENLRHLYCACSRAVKEKAQPYAVWNLRGRNANMVLNSAERITDIQTPGSFLWGSWMEKPR